MASLGKGFADITPQRLGILMEKVTILRIDDVMESTYEDEGKRTENLSNLLEASKNIESLRVKGPPSGSYSFFLTNALRSHRFPKLCIVELEDVGADMQQIYAFLARHSHCLVEISLRDTNAQDLDTDWVATLDKLSSDCVFQRLDKFRLCSRYETAGRSVDVTDYVRRGEGVNPLADVYADASGETSSSEEGAESLSSPSQD